MARGFTLRETAAVVAMGAVGVAVAGPIVGRVGPEAKRAVSLANLRAIGAASGSYRADHDGYFPIVMPLAVRGMAGPGQGSSFCSWSFGGKNNSGWWASGMYRAFDIEAADRPLNPYAVPGVTFYAPPPPATLPATHPARLTEQATVFQDPGDTVTHQRRWPAPSQGVTGYDDVGTSYQTNFQWWDQVYTGGGQPSFVAAFNEATRKIARGDGADPARFVWAADDYSSLLARPSSGSLVNGYGDLNRSSSLFVDGHAEYLLMTPGFAGHSTPTYTLIFE